MEQLVTVSGACTGCAYCFLICPADAIRVDGKASIDPTKCDGCGKCISVCPVGAIEWPGESGGVAFNV